jgi:hypothetical protein
VGRGQFFIDTARYIFMLKFVKAKGSLSQPIFSVDELLAGDNLLIEELLKPSYDDKEDEFASLQFILDENLGDLYNQ